jgi:hypothetical protein
VAIITGPAGIQAVTGELSYLAPESTVLRRFTAPGESVNTGVYRAYEMRIRDGRPVSDQLRSTATASRSSTTPRR